ncbi:hypothetical protein [Streptomyces sp.]|uniref:hypothetical protein n=1 Tax=Streptomyces sp. TaxID=1931 RepID=UPI002F3FF3DC
MAGSVMAAGVSAPAFADSSMTAMPTSINGGVDRVLSEQPLQRAVDETEVGSALDSATRSAGRLQQGNGAGALLGQATGAANGAAPSLLGGMPLFSLLGGLPLGG